MSYFDKMRSQDEIIAAWGDEIDAPKVSIVCAAYNHAKYIEKTLHGFLIQETNFPFEILIHDDASIDETARIIKQYECLYPKIIKVIYQSENQYSKSISPNWSFNFPRVLGEYVAFCEGDDYWIDSKQIQKQYDFLNDIKNKMYVLCYHDVSLIDEFGNLIKERRWATKNQKDWDSNDLILMRHRIHLASCMFRNVLPDLIEKYDRRGISTKNGDSFLIAILGKYGVAKYLDDIFPACYRIHDQGAWSSKGDRERYHEITSYFKDLCFFFQGDNKILKNILFLISQREVKAEFMLEASEINNLLYEKKSDSIFLYGDGSYADLIRSRIKRFNINIKDVLTTLNNEVVSKKTGQKVDVSYLSECPILIASSFHEEIINFLIGKSLKKEKIIMLYPIRDVDRVN